MRIENTLSVTCYADTFDTSKHAPCQACDGSPNNARCAWSLIKSGTSVTSGTSYISACICLGFPVPEPVPSPYRGRHTAPVSGVRAEASNGAMPTAARSQAARQRRVASPLRCEARGPHSAAGANLTPRPVERSASRVVRRRADVVPSKHVARSGTGTAAGVERVRSRADCIPRSRRLYLCTCRAAFHVQPSEVRA